MTLASFPVLLTFPWSTVIVGVVPHGKHKPKCSNAAVCVVKPGSLEYKVSCYEMRRCRQQNCGPQQEPYPRVLELKVAQRTKFHPQTQMVSILEPRAWTPKPEYPWTSEAA